ncbi:RNA methylase [Planoprotostelium fungivorum]|uniref:RNA methylase n=1 Tax=Planoprotostelium fungivorum TaxID=1890364 RepID=A0A2P6NCT1_9EUKA|nr:RNA methylase [Planoprotostelium fungivorum]
MDVTEVFRDFEHESFEQSPFPLLIDGIDTAFAPFIPTSIGRVISSLTHLGVGKDDVILDLGSGDGRCGNSMKCHPCLTLKRFCVAAVQKFGVKRAIGVELEADLVDKSAELSQKCGVPSYTNKEPEEEERGDIMDEGIQPVVSSPKVTAVIVYLCHEGALATQSLVLDHYERGAVILAVSFPMLFASELQLKFHDHQTNIWIYSKR